MTGVAGFVTLLIFMLTLVFKFPSEIRDLIKSFSSRNTKVEVGGNKLFSLDLSYAIPLPQAAQNTEYPKTLKAFQSAIITDEENLIKAQIKHRGFTEQQAIEALITHLANSNLIIKILMIRKDIFLEQIELLSFLNFKNTFATESDLMVFYEKWLKNSNKPDYKFEDFLAWLGNNSLIYRNLDGYFITPLGKEYLCFLIKIGRPY